MKEVFYKGHPYEYKIVNVMGKRQFQLFKEGVLQHTVEQCELDIKSIVTLILDAYYRNAQNRAQAQAVR
jgi:hypothetical protein